MQSSLLSSETLKITPLGAGCEVGRSCIILQYKTKTIMFDCGIHPAHSGINSLPFFDEIDPSTVDIVLVTHFHLDHAASLPYFTEKTNFRGKVFMTHPTKAIYKWILSDFIRVNNVSSGNDNLFSEKDLVKSFEKIVAVDYHQQIDVDGIKITAYNAGHVLGAAMFLVEIAGVTILYTGDYSREEDRHLMAAEKPETDKPIDILITESTYGVKSHLPRVEREKRFTGLVHEVVSRGGRCLLPVFALGRAQELLLILDEYWQEHPELHKVPIYYASVLAKRCMSIYQTYINMMNDRIRKQYSYANPFIFKHVQSILSIDQFDDIGPCVMMASPGMLQSGFSRQLFETWCPNKKNGIVIAGYSVEGTLARHILTEPNEIVAMSGAKIPLRMTVEYISFSAHVDYQQNSQFISLLKPANVVLVHGEMNEMFRLKAALSQKLEQQVIDTKVFSPRNCETVSFEFRGDKYARLIGRNATLQRTATDSVTVNGILIGKDFEYEIVDPLELREFSNISLCVVKQRQYFTLSVPSFHIEYHLSMLFGPSSIKREENVLRIMNCATLTEIERNRFMLEWEGNVMNDMIADSIIAVALHAQSSRTAVKLSKSDSEHSHVHGNLDIVFNYLNEHFTDVVIDEENGMINLLCNGTSATVDTETFNVVCEDKETESLIERKLSKLFDVMVYC